MTGAIPAAPLIAVVDEKPTPEPPKAKAKPKRKAQERATPTPAPATVVVQAVHADPVAAEAVDAQAGRQGPKPAKKKTSKDEFGFEDEGGDRARPTPPPVKATISSVGGSGGATRSSGGGGSAPAGSPGKEFGFEGG